MKKIIFFTSKYPFRVVGENFFESELAGVAPNYDEVYIVTCNTREKNKTIQKELPQNVKAIAINRNSFYSDIILGALSLPFSKDFYREFGQLLKEKKPLLAGLKRILYSVSYYNAICRHLKGVADKIPMDKDDDITLCGYWLSYISAAILKFKKYLPNDDIKVVSRAHGPADIINLMTPNRFFPFQQFLLKNLDGVLGISDSGCDYLKSLSPRPEIISRIYIGSLGNAEYIEHSRAPFTVMTCANFFKHKRVSIVADAIHILVKDIPDIKWVHFGDGPLREQIENSCQDIKENIEFKGNRPHDELIAYLESGKPSVFVSASAAEGLPVSIMEALAYSTPVVATDVNASREAVISGKTGTLVNADITPEEIAAAVLEYYKMNDEDYDAICRSAHSFWKENLDSIETSKLLAQKLLTY